MNTVDRWLPLRAQAGPGGLPLFCLPHAGGGASAFRTWLGNLPGVSVLPVQPPGREARFREEPFSSMAPLVAELASVVLSEADGRPYAVYGHSLGALVSFELLREIRRRGAPPPVHWFVSGCVAPHRTYDDGPPVAPMSRPDIVDVLRRLGGTPEWLLSDPSVVDMILPAVRADFSVKETYCYTSDSPLTVPLTVLSSTDDPRAPQDLQSAWQEQTLGTFDLHTLMGGHFAVFDQPTLTHKIMDTALRPWCV